MLVIFAVAAVLAGCADDAGDTATPPPPANAGLRAEVLAESPHDPRAFTQGLELVDGVLYEGTGLEGRSSIRRTDPATGEVRASVDLDRDLFGEGITVVGPTIWQLTWRNGVVIQRDRNTLAELRRVPYTGEGWGLCHDPAADRLIMSDGSDTLTFRDPRTFAETGRLRTDVLAKVPGTRPDELLNELECAHGAVYANVWKQDVIARVDVRSGEVTVADLTAVRARLPEDARKDVDVLNGIAAIPGTDEFLVTGKLWPRTFRVKLVTTR
ncbi:glutaminyl-peptide cyclotransferase [Herbihabitans rhizosphaerae]|uniref:glutaminyl-peptide cyclotransferase n=1 Tax=Herbihabitans rhizosphaerae TaxID=1872711 RepID=UPI003BF8DA41